MTRETNFQVLFEDEVVFVSEDYAIVLISNFERGKLSLLVSSFPSESSNPQVVTKLGVIYSQEQVVEDIWIML